MTSQCQCRGPWTWITATALAMYGHGLAGTSKIPVSQEKVSPRTVFPGKNCPPGRHFFLGKTDPPPPRKKCPPVFSHKNEFTVKKNCPPPGRVFLAHGCICSLLVPPAHKNVGREQTCARLAHQKSHKICSNLLTYEDQEKIFAAAFGGQNRVKNTFKITILPSLRAKIAPL